MPFESEAVSMLEKSCINSFDEGAKIILFGSRATDDASQESDLDFLVLTEKKDTELLATGLRKKIREEVELQLNVAVSLIVKSKLIWEDDYAVTNIYESIREEGVVV
jgi:predicted nucleotidyltransferase